MCDSTDAANAQNSNVSLVDHWIATGHDPNRENRRADTVDGRKSFPPPTGPFKRDIQYTRKSYIFRCFYITCRVMYSRLLTFP